MRKILGAIVVTSALSISAMAGQWVSGTVGYIQFTDTLAKVEVVSDSGNVVKNIDPQGTFFKEMVATLLTAKASDKPVVLYDDAGMWTKIKLP